jgi:crotonobetainyl-CoA:carnitine CoA-transferase CaiB-like acyl-CoA transferase
MQFDRHGLAIERNAPGIGEHTDEVFRELGMDDEELTRLRDKGVLV